MKRDQLLLLQYPLQIAIFSFLLITFCAGTNAEVGTLEEVIKSAKANEEPGYIEELMIRMGEELNQVMRALFTPLESTLPKLAWLHTMGGVVKVTWNAARSAALDAASSASWNCDNDDVKYGTWDAALYAAQNAALYAAKNSAENAAKNTDWSAAWNAALAAARSIVKDAAEDAAKYVAKNAAKNAVTQGASAQEIGRISYRVAEWVVLNYLLRNIKVIVQVVHPSVLKALGENPAGNPFVDHDSWLATYKNHFAWLEPEAMMFLAPWLAQIVRIEGLEAAHQSLLGMANINVLASLVAALFGPPK